MTKTNYGKTIYIFAIVTLCNVYVIDDTMFENIENVHIVITDSTELVVVNEYVNLSHVGICIQLPDTGDNEVYKKEIEYGDTYLYGMID